MITYTPVPPPRAARSAILLIVALKNERSCQHHDARTTREPEKQNITYTISAHSPCAPGISITQTPTSSCALACATRRTSTANVRSQVTWAFTRSMKSRISPLARTSVMDWEKSPGVEEVLRGDGLWVACVAGGGEEGEAGRKA